MNIVTPFPNVNINTANVYTETARRDNQLREVIPPPAATKPSNAENKALGDNDKAKQPGTSESVTYDSKGKVADETVVQEREQGEQNPDQQSEEQQKEAKKEQQVAEQEELDAAQIEELKARDTEVRVHEQAHASIGGQYAGSPSYEYQRGPDGQNYAVGGEVQIDVAEVEGDPQATIEKMQTVRAAALAPAEPSSADRAIAADATQKLAAAQAELTTPENNDDSDEGNGASFKIDNAGEQSASITNSETATAKRDADVDARAGRIAQFYQAATSPYGQAGFSATI
ncbi:catalase [Pseudoalteromonas shioyasakiensis]|uniref:putative metalloprotease CJM1_0395 family protein n=1 Tax=Pseudoalteromonas shioyasakiensis TaxID=1190813 RepID=UPI0021198824|nr:putative metalloprotease CJM1_0395 family protein [Pseudoalteromonas shioyasakiensis]MCQ8879820.1 catalase [Pseudoalteromonas shioyasakiensis]